MNTKSVAEVVQRIDESRTLYADMKPSEMTLERDIMDAIISGEADIVLRSPASTSRFCQLTNAVEVLRDMRTA